MHTKSNRSFLPATWGGTAKDAATNKGRALPPPIEAAPGAVSQWLIQATPANSDLCAPFLGPSQWSHRFNSDREVYKQKWPAVVLLCIASQSNGHGSNPSTRPWAQAENCAQMCISRGSCAVVKSALRVAHGGGTLGIRTTFEERLSPTKDRTTHRRDHERSVFLLVFERDSGVQVVLIVRTNQKGAKSERGTWRDALDHSGGDCTSEDRVLAKAAEYRRTNREMLAVQENPRPPHNWPKYRECVENTHGVLKIELRTGNLDTRGDCDGNYPRCRISRRAAAELIR